MLLSGQDYPIRDLAAWEDEVRRAGVDALIDVRGIGQAKLEALRDLVTAGTGT